MADAGQDPEGELDNHVVDPPEDAVDTTEGGSPSALSAIPEEADSDFSGHIQQVMLAAWQQVEGSEDLNKEYEELETSDSQQMIYAAVEHAAAGLGRRPGEWPQHLETLQQRHVIHEQCLYYLLGASLDDYATLEEEDEGG